LGKGFPEAQITLLTLPWLQGFIAGRYPYLHRVEGVSPYPRIHQPGPADPPAHEDADTFFARMQAEAFDLAIQMHGGGTDSNPFVARLGARHTLGLQAEGAPPLERNLRYFYYQSETARYLELVGMLGVAGDGLDADLAVLPQDRERLAAIWSPGSACYAVVHPGAGDVRRRWPVERFARIAEHLYERWGLTPVVTGREDEGAAIAQLAATCRVPLVDLSRRLDLGALAALVAGASFMLCNDSGPAHMAYALRVPSVVIYWAGNVITAGPARRERYRPVLSWTLSCPQCGTQGRCACPASWVAEASTEEVLAQTDDLLREQG